MSSAPLISVVVPIYNVENYLRECLDSLLVQTYRNLEIILVDDGSKDNCGKICDEYAALDRRIRVLHQPNGGLGNAYNNGIAAAGGDYVGMVESDDFAEPDLYERLLASALKYDSDLVKCDFFNYDSFQEPQDRSDNILSQLAPDDKAFKISEYPALFTFHSSVWASLYKADFIKHLKFTETKSAAYQDLSFMFEALARAKKISVVHQSLLHYRQEAGNFSSTSRSDERLIQIPVQIMEAWKRVSVLENYKEFEEAFWVAATKNAIAFFKKIRPELKVRYFEKLSEAYRPLRDYKEYDFEALSPWEKMFLEFVLAGSFKKAAWLYLMNSPQKSYGGLWVKYLKCRLFALFLRKKEKKHYKNKAIELRERIKDWQIICKTMKN